MGFLRFGRSSRYSANQPEPTTEQNAKAIKFMVWIGIIAIVVFAFSAFSRYFNQQKASVNEFIISENQQEITIVVNLDNSESSDWHCELKPEKESEKAYVYVELHRRRTGKEIEEGNKFTLPLKEEDAYVGIKIDGEAYELIAVKDSKSNEWRTPTTSEKLKYYFAHMWQM